MSAADPIEINRRNWDERALIHGSDTTGTYALDRLRAGESVLDPLVAAELGDIAGQRVLHLQCHIGTDTLSLVRHGAIVTGLDFSANALAVARRLAAETGLTATFVHGRVENTPGLAPGPFDLVFVTWGTICWLPDIRAWARAIAYVLAPGGSLYFADAHPCFLALDVRDGRLTPTFDYATPIDAPLQFINPTTYTGDPTALVHQENREWIHPVSGIIGALLAAGLDLEMLREHDVLPWSAPGLVATTDRFWRLPDGHPRFPLSLSLRARKRR